MNEEYLSHHGIKGQKWGVRRFQNSDGTLTAAGKKHYSRKELKKIRNEKGHLIEKFEKNDPRQKRLKEIEKETTRLANNYDFDQDDGGGGTTRADQAAGRKYMQLYDEYALLEDSISETAREKAAKAIVDKYGQEAIDGINLMNMETAVAFVAAIWAIPIAVIAFANNTNK